MAIRPPQSSDLTGLLDALSSGEALQRDSAVARLTLIGRRAAPKLAALTTDSSTSGGTRAAALQALAAIGGPHALAAARASLDAAEDAVACEAVDILGAFARGNGREASRALDDLTGLALSAVAPTDRRLAAIAALKGLPDRLMQPVYDALARDRSPRIVAHIAGRRAGAISSLEEVAERALPDTPELLAALVRDDGEGTGVTVLRKLIDVVRQREAITTTDERGLWCSVRGQIHAVLASRGSRIAVYDLRETLEQTAGPLPIGFLSATAMVADAGCLEAIASAWMNASGADRWFRDHLTDVFRTIVARERITRDHATMQHILTRYPAAGVLVAEAPRKTRARAVSTPSRTKA